jgi:murein DD-endopeptidase MepM/ murein hydrolase activator NlpD
MRFGRDPIFYKRRSRFGPVALIILCLALAAGGWYYYGHAARARAKAKATPTPAAKPSPTPAPTPALPGTPHAGEIAKGQNLFPALQAAGVADADANAVIESLKAVDFPFRNIRPAQTFTAYFGDADAFTGLDYTFDRSVRYEVRREADKLVARKLETPTALTIQTIGARVTDCVYNAILSQNETDELASLVSNLFAWDIDFSLDPRAGDSFRLIFEKKKMASGEMLGYGRLLAGEYDGQRTGRKQGFWLEVGDPEIDGFYDETGMQMRKTFLRAPLDTMRITSRFGMRFHPILHRRMMHEGVDYGAATGTPVWAVANGTVIFSGSAGGAGNMVRIRHAGDVVSMYLHLSRLAVRNGQHVRQRQLIGRVGSTGRATGPHLDFRLTRNNEYLNPQKMKMYSQSKKLPDQYRAQFDQVMARLRPQLEAIRLPPPPATTPTPDTETDAAAPTP